MRRDSSLENERKIIPRGRAPLGLNRLTMTLWLNYRKRSANVVDDLVRDAKLKYANLRNASFVDARCDLVILFFDATKFLSRLSLPVIKEEKRD